MSVSLKALRRQPRILKVPLLKVQLLSNRVKESVFHGQIVRENIDAQAASTDGRVTLYANDQAHMFGRKVVIKNNGGGLNIKKQNHLFFSFPT